MRESGTGSSLYKRCRNVFLLHCCYLFLSFATAANDQCTPADIVRGTCEPSKPVKPPRATEGCGIYLAKSSIPNAGYGVFAGKDFPKDSFLTKPPESPALSVTDVFYHYDEDPVWAHVNYFWSGDGYTARESEETAEMTFNIGAIANYHTYLVNLEHWAGDYDDQILNRFEDSGAGAISYYKGHQFIAVQDIKAGQELFADYGEEWLTSRQGFEGVALRDDYVKAGKIVTTLYQVWKQGQLEGAKYDVTSLIQSIVSGLDERVASVLPKNRDEFDSLLQTIDELSGETIENLTNQDVIEKSIALSSTESRNIPWLQENGMCIDNIMSGKSTIEGAGFGAFVKRRITKGGMIAPAPLLTLTDKEALDMYTLTRNDNDELIHLDENVVGKQLLLNYCFSHNETSMVLCPSTNIILANHCSDRRDWKGSCGSEGPNAFVRWGYWDESTSVWLDSSVEEIQEKIGRQERGLSMELIALREINPGEEIFIDYGIEWENAFLDHKANWKPPAKNTGFENYKSVKTMMEDNVGYTFRTMDEEINDPYPENVQTVCYKLYDNFDDPVDISQLTDEEILIFKDEAMEEEIEDVKYFGFRNEDDIIEIDDEAPNQIVTDGSDNIDDKRSSSEGWSWPCQILSRDDDNNTYTVRILHSSSDTTIGWAILRYARILHNYPGESIKFGNIPYKSDQFLPGAFRHHIGLNDKMMPDVWKNLSI